MLLGSDDHSRQDQHAAAAEVHDFHHFVVARLSSDGPEVTDLFTAPLTAHLTARSLSFTVLFTAPFTALVLTVCCPFTAFC